VAASTPTGPNSPLVRTLGILSVLIALAGVITIFAKGTDNDNSSSNPPASGSTPLATPTGRASVSPLPSPTITPSPTLHATGTARTTASGTPTVAPTATHPAGHSAAPSTPASSPTSNAGSHQVTLQTPALGDYSYSTTGGESTSFPGTGRTFPKTTTVSLTKSGCGIKETWKPLASHVETEQLCLINNQVHLLSYQTTLGFFGQSVTQKFTCTNAYIYAPTSRPGDSWSFSCSGEGAKVTQTLKALRYQTFTIGGTKVKTLKISVSSAIAGGDSGDSKQTIWIAATNRPQMIRNVASINAKQGSFSYRENATLQLESLTPR
jgi:hypothetical protein